MNDYHEAVSFSDIRKVKKVNGLWIGATHVDGQYSWTDGESFTWYPFASPTNPAVTAEKNCFTVAGSGDQNDWSVTECTELRQSLCEMDLGKNI